MSNNTNQPSPFIDELGERVEVTITFPVLRFPMWRIAVWKVHDSRDKDRALALSFYSFEPLNVRVPRRLYDIGRLFDEGDNPLKPLWQHYPGMRLAIGLQLLMFHELPPVLTQTLEQFTLRELEARNPYLVESRDDDGIG